jgi:hypothetical protein
VPPAERRPLIVLSDAHALAALRVKLERDGWTVNDGWSLAAPDWDVSGLRVVCSGRLEREDELQAALLVAARGAGVIVLTPPEPPDSFVEDLERIGEVELRTGAGGLDDHELRELLRALAAGRPIAAAASEALLSLRTAHRRLAGARTALGVSTNRELLTEYARRYGGLD